MATQKLTKRVVDALPRPTRRVIIYDTDLKGFGVKITPNGTKSWCVEYRPGSGGRSVAKRRLVLGSTSTLTPDQARDAAKNVLASVALGGDPAATRSRSREMPNFREFAERYLAEEAQPKLKPNTVINYRIYLRKHAVPHIGSLKLDKITPADIAKLHRRIGQKTPMAANRVACCVGSVYRYAATCGFVRAGIIRPLKLNLSASVAANNS